MMSCAHRWLEFETVLGPEDAENQPAAQRKPQQLDQAGGLGAPSTTMMGLDPAPTGTEQQQTVPSIAPPARPRNDGKLGATAKAQGPGIPDLLTKGDSTAVYALGARRLGEYTHRLDRIEQLVGALVGRTAERRAPSSGRTVVSVPSTPYFETSADPIESTYGCEPIANGGARRESDRSPV